VVVRHSDSLALRDGMTLEAWLRPTAGRGTWHPVLRKDGAGAAAYAMYASDPGGRPIAMAGSARARASDAGSTLPLRAWSHLAVTYDGRMLRVYVNGRLVASRPRSGLLPRGRGTLRIGGGDRAGEAFAGQIDDVRIYDRALDASAIARDMRAAV
jgi:hypothetical protein